MAAKQNKPDVEELLEATTPRVADLEHELRTANRKIESLAREKASQQNLIKQYEKLLREAKIVKEAGPPKIRRIKPKVAWSTEATCLLVASDWHVEELVDPKTVNDLNEYNPDISAARAERFFKAGLRLTQIIQQDVTVNTIVLPLLGDFITNQLHDDSAESNDRLPMDAVLMAQSYLASGITFLLENSDCKLVIPCHSGNHGRTTDRVHMGGEAGHSLEYFMYRNLEHHFRDEPRAAFHVSLAYHSYMEIYDQAIRFHHGHAMRYYGGIGGIYIPVYKAIAQWNKARQVDLDVFAHFHQLRDGGNFVSNGSLIGWSPYSMRIKADFDVPKQAFVVIDNKHGRTFTCPIYVKRRAAEK
jgi:hypothetical protein